MELRRGWALQAPATFARPIFASEWPWPLWLAQPRFTACLGGQRVVVFGVARYDEGAIFVGKTEKGGCFSIGPSISGHMMFHWTVDGVDWS